MSPGQDGTIIDQFATQTSFLSLVCLDGS